MPKSNKAGGGGNARARVASNSSTFGTGQRVAQAETALASAGVQSRFEGALQVYDYGNSVQIRTNAGTNVGVLPRTGISVQSVQSLVSDFDQMIAEDRALRNLNNNGTLRRR